MTQNYKFLDNINFPSDLRKISEKDLQKVSDEVRKEMISAVSETGGHLGAGLGVVELTVALHYVFDTPNDKLIWDVGHQSYPHKIITGRKKKIRTLRQGDGLSGFTKRSESEYDPFGAAHSSTSISSALGIAEANKLANKTSNVIAVIGDGAISANISTKLSSVQASDVKEEFGSKIKYLLNGGKCNIGVESTIINLTNKPTLLRFGGLEISKIEKILKKKIPININSKKKIVPGQFPLHYSPGVPLRVNVKKSKSNEAFVLIKKRNINSKNYYYLSKKKDLKEAAKNLYSILRKIKKDGYKMIAVEKIPNIGIGKTINDRLNRASKY